MRKRRELSNLNLENMKEIALKRATSKTYFAIGLLALSLFAAFAITGKANRSISVWSARTDLVAGERLSSENTQEIKVFLPGNSARYIESSSKIMNRIINRGVSIGELIPLSAVADRYSGEKMRSVPLKIARNDLPSDLISGNNVDIYFLPQPELNSSKVRKTQLISQGVTVESIDLKSKDMGGDIGIVLKIPESQVLDLLALLNNSRIVVVRNAI